MDVSPAKRSYFTCANVWWKLLFHSTRFCEPCELLIEKVNATLRSFALKRRHRGCIYLCNHSNMNLLSGSNMKGVSIYEYFY